MIHPSSVISKEAEIDPTAIVGPFCVIAGKTKIGAGTKLFNNVTIGSDFGEVVVGKNNQFFPGCVVGGPPQDLKYKNEPTKLIIGDDNKFRECVTLNLGTPTGTGFTQVGDDNLLMAYTHVAHDCKIGSHTAIANSCQFAGHVVVGDYVKISGMCGLAQFIRLGDYSYIGGNSVLNKDVLPYSIAEGSWARVRATNKVGLQRAGYSKEEIENIHLAIRIVAKGEGTMDEAFQRIQADCQQNEHIKYILDFIKSSEKGIAK